MPDLYSPKEKKAKDIDLAHFLEDGVKVKNYLRLSHLYTPSVLKLRKEQIIFLCQLSYILDTWTVELSGFLGFRTMKVHTL